MYDGTYSNAFYNTWEVETANSDYLVLRVYPLPRIVLLFGFVGTLFLSSLMISLFSQRIVSEVSILLSLAATAFFGILLFAKITLIFDRRIGETLFKAAIAKKTRRLALPAVCNVCIDSGLRSSVFLGCIGQPTLLLTSQAVWKARRLGRALGQFFCVPVFETVENKLTCISAPELAETIRMHTQFLAANKRNAASLFLRGSAFLQQREYAQAVDDFSTYLTLDSADVRALITRWWLFLRLNAADKADVDFQNFMRISAERGSTIRDLHWAIECGFDLWDRIEAEPCFDPLRDTEEFKRLLALKLKTKDAANN